MIPSIHRYLNAFRNEKRGKAIFAIASSSFLLIGVQMIYPILLPELRSNYDLGLGTAGLLLTILWLSNAIGQVPGGVLADVIGEGRILVAGTVLSAVTILFIVTAQSVVVVFSSTFLLGLGLALFGVARYTALEDLFPEHVGSAVGVVLAAADAGQALLPPIAGFLAAAAIWQLGFAYTLPLFAIVTAALWLYVPARTSDRDTNAETSSRERFRHVWLAIRQRSVLYGSGTFVVYMIVWITFTGFYPSYLIEVKDVPDLITGILFGIFFAIGVVIKPLSGVAYDRFGIRLTLLVTSSISGISLLIFPFVDGVVSLGILTILVAPILSSGTVAQSHIIEALPSNIKGTGLGLVRTGGMTMAAMSPAVFGMFADMGFFNEVFISLAALAGLMVVLLLRIPAAGLK